MKEVQITLKFTRQQVADLLCTGLEGGINYWGYVEGFQATSSPRSLLRSLGCCG
jgi:hypothetical protein